MTQLKNRRCKICNWLNMEIPASFKCTNCGKDNSQQDKEEAVIEEPKQIKPSNDWLQEVDDIKGIGEETLSDIERIYSSKEALIRALKYDICPFRNDVVKRLKSQLIK